MRFCQALIWMWFLTPQLPFSPTCEFCQKEIYPTLCLHIMPRIIWAMLRFLSFLSQSMFLFLLFNWMTTILRMYRPAEAQNWTWITLPSTSMLRNFLFLALLFSLWVIVILLQFKIQSSPSLKMEMWSLWCQSWPLMISIVLFQSAQSSLRSWIESVLCQLLSLRWSEKVLWFIRIRV